MRIYIKLNLKWNDTNVTYILKKNYYHYIKMKNTTVPKSNRKTCKMDTFKHKYTCIYMTTHFSGFELLKSGGVKLDSWHQTFPISWLRNPTQWLTIYRKAVVIPNSDVFSLNRYRCDGTRGSCWCYWKLIGNGFVMLRRYSVTIERLKEVMATSILITNCI
jgi:hypothetical protein